MSLGAPPALAQTEPGASGNLPGHFTVRVGTFIGSDLNTKLRLDSKRLDRGTTIDLEEALGLEPSARSFSAALTWRVHRRHQLELGYYALKRRNTKQISRDIDIGDTTWTIGSTVSADFNTSYATFAYRWSPILTSRVSAGLGLRIPVLFFSTSLSASLLNVQLQARRRDNATVPIPLPGVHATVRLADPLYVHAEAQYLKVSVADIKTDILGFQGLVHYYPIRTLGVAAGVMGDYSLVESHSKKFTGRLLYDVLGASVQITWIP